MAGVEILSEQIVYNAFIPVWGVIIAFICAGIAWLIGAILISYDKSPVISGFAILICLAIAVFGLIDNKKDIDYIEYKVTIDDSVSMNEFLDKYEILDQEGKIYIIKEKE